MFYKSGARSPSTEVAVLALSGITSSVWHPWSQLLQHRSCATSAVPTLFPATAPRCLSKRDTNSPATSSFQKQTSWVTFHARNAINGHPGLQSYGFRLP